MFKMDMERLDYVLSNLNEEETSLINELRERGEHEAAAVIQTFNKDRKQAKEFIIDLTNFRMPELDYNNKRIEEDGLFIPFKDI
jgi:hypothetical protein